MQLTQLLDLALLEKKTTLWQQCMLNKRLTRKKKNMHYSIALVGCSCEVLTNMTIYSRTVDYFVYYSVFLRGPVLFNTMPKVNVMHVLVLL